jgi:hypothetical protein
MRPDAQKWRVCLLASLTLCIIARTLAQSSDNDDREKEKSDLGKRLLEGSTAQDEDIMAQIIALMDKSHERLRNEFDPGPQTRAVQKQILDRLDDAIDIALRNRSEVSATQAAAGDPRKMPQPEEGDKAGGKSASGAQQSNPEGAKPTGDIDPPESRRGGAFRESRRGWGHLPPRERDQIIQSIDETFLEPYRELIEEYYKALAEPESP